MDQKLKEFLSSCLRFEQELKANKETDSKIKKYLDDCAKWSSFPDANEVSNELDAFVGNFFTILSKDLVFDRWVQCVTVFFKAIKADDQVFKRFKANHTALKQMKNFSSYLDVAKAKDDKARGKTSLFGDEYLTLLKFCSLILRHHSLHIRVEDAMTLSPQIYRDIVKCENYSIYSDLEDISSGLEVQILNFNDYREVTSNGFKEIIALTDKMKAEAIAQAKREAKAVEDRLLGVLGEQTQKVDQLVEKAMAVAGAPPKEAAPPAGMIQESRILAIEQRLDSLGTRFDTSMTSQLNELQVKNIIIEEVNAHSRTVNDNMKQNLSSQKKDSESMVKRLGLNIQDALIKIRDEMQFEYKDLISQVEQKTTKNIKIMTEDVNDFGQKWDNELSRFQLTMNKKIDENESTAHKEFAKLLDESMQSVEDSLNSNVIVKLRELDQSVKDLKFLDSSFSKLESSQKQQIETMQDKLRDQTSGLQNLEQAQRKQAKDLEETKFAVQDQVSQFEANALKELKNATKHFSFKAYEQSFDKIETDQRSFHKSLEILQQEFKESSASLNSWKTGFQDDFQTFVAKYDSSFRQHRQETVQKQAEIVSTFQDLSQETLMNKNNIKLVAQEALKNQEAYEKEKVRFEEVREQIKQLQRDIIKQAKDSHDAHSRLTTDLFDQIKTIKGLMDPEPLLEQEREQIDLKFKVEVDKLRSQMDEQVNLIQSGLEDSLSKYESTVQNLQSTQLSYESRLAPLEDFKKNPIALVQQIDSIKVTTKGVAYLFQHYTKGAAASKADLFHRNSTSTETQKFDMALWLFNNAPVLSSKDFIKLIRALLSYVRDSGKKGQQVPFYEIKHKSISAFELCDRVHDALNDEPFQESIEKLNNIFVEVRNVGTKTFDFLEDFWKESMFSDQASLKQFFVTKNGRLSLGLALIEIISRNRICLKQLKFANFDVLLNEIILGSSSDKDAQLSTAMAVKCLKNMMDEDEYKFEFFVDGEGRKVINHLFHLMANQSFEQAEFISDVVLLLRGFLVSETTSLPGQFSKMNPQCGSLILDILSAHHKNVLSYNLMCDGLSALEAWYSIPANLAGLKDVANDLSDLILKVNNNSLLLDGEFAVQHAKNVRDNNRNKQGLCLIDPAIATGQVEIRNPKGCKEAMFKLLSHLKDSSYFTEILTSKGGKFLLQDALNK